jgi:DNA adenine methylase
MNVATPISYYGGKQRMLQHILPVLPSEFNLYCEPFVGGGAVFWAKEPSPLEVINDTNRELINFYEVCQNEFVDLEKLIRITLHSRTLFNDARVIYENPHMFNRIKRAWAVWVLSSQGFAAKIDGSWGYDKLKGTVSTKIKNKRDNFTEELAIRLQKVQIECTDALRIIRSRDSKDSFFYCDPPYFNSDCGHYDGYTIDDFEMLLKQLSNIEGRFLLSSYPSKILDEYVKQNGWNQQCFSQKVSVSRTKENQKTKIEVLTANYPLIS